MSDITSKIKTFEDACSHLNIGTDLPEVGNLPEKHRSALQAHYKLIIIAQALNDGWEPNWNDWNEYKYYPWPDVDADADRPAGFGLSHFGYVYWYSITHVGSRLCYRTRELARYAFNQFKELYEEYFLIR